MNGIYAKVFVPYPIFEIVKNKREDYSLGDILYDTIYSYAIFLHIDKSTSIRIPCDATLTYKQVLNLIRFRGEIFKSFSIISDGVLL